MMKFYRIVLICTLIISCRAAISGSGSGSGSVATKALEQFITTSSLHVCGLTDLGFIECFGYGGGERTNDDKPRTPTDGSTKFTQVSGGHGHTCGVTDKGSIECFGFQNKRKSKYVLKSKRPSNSKESFIQVSAGLYDTCGVTSVGGIECFGDRADKRDKPISEGKFIQVSADKDLTCGLTDKGVIECLGQSETDKLMQHRFSNYKYKQISSSYVGNYVCGLRHDGVTDCFDGKGTHTHSQTKFTQVSVSAYAMSAFYACGIVDSNAGEIKCFGYNFIGSNFHAIKKTSKADKGVKFIEVRTGPYHACGLTSIGEIECWGTDRGKKHANDYKARKPKTKGCLAFGLFCKTENDKRCISINLCPADTYKHDNTCKSCPAERPSTNSQIGKTRESQCETKRLGSPDCKAGSGINDDGECEKCSKNTVSPGGKGAKCKKYCIPGEAIQSEELVMEGSCNIPMSKAECKGYAQKRKGNLSDVKEQTGIEPPGCYLFKSPTGDRYMYNTVISSPKHCTETRRCICSKATDCTKCPNSYYSNHDTNGKCEFCKAPKLSDRKQTKCFSQSDFFEEIKRDINTQKETTNDLSLKNSRLWQKEEIRNWHDRMMANRKSDDVKNETKICEKQRADGIVIFPAIEVPNEIELNESTTCIDMNRDELLKSFCNFRSDLDNFLMEFSIGKEAKMFWPNICCKERHDVDTKKTLETCNPPEDSDVKPGDMIPFALSQGGNFNRHNLYVEVKETIKEQGHLHKGMIKLLDEIKEVTPHNNHPKIENAKELVQSFFNGISLCGPRLIDGPEENKMCELFIPYGHSMKHFLKLVRGLYETKFNILPVSFLETMEHSLLNRQLASRKIRLGKSGKNTLTSAMQSKKPTVIQKTIIKEIEPKKMCKKVILNTNNLEDKQNSFCSGVEHMDLHNKNVKNVAIYYLRKKMSEKYVGDNKNMELLAEKIRYRVVDESCPSKLFDAKDISIQRIAMDTKGKIKEWVAVVHLNTESEDGYFKNELPNCKARNYLIGTTITVEAYIDDKNCCKDYRDFDTCKHFKNCENQLLEGKLADFENKHFTRRVMVKGTKYKISNPHDQRRRRLLTKTGGKNGS